MTSKKLNYSALYLWYERGLEGEINLLINFGFKLSDERWVGAQNMITGHNSRVETAPQALSAFMQARLLSTSQVP